MTEIDLYNLMKPLNHIFEGYKNKTVHQLTPDELEEMKEIYSAVQRVYPNVLPPIFVTTCPSCVIEALEQFISIYDRLSSTLADVVLVMKLDGEPVAMKNIVDGKIEAYNSDELVGDGDNDADEMIKAYNSTLDKPEPVKKGRKK
ncbi:hypothetical protein OQZ33_07010 [Pedobacter sp. MC2016-05]|uniref:hypothetical protein n=1 Tax=Pedobacter sp. MC2016-05 TaxID=2994474 RepID=UPI0022480F3F|nr:hypothetical protein [Pedobacter sp. MC2016-05]MCX2474074.1 hypothetical protein [Pedobacter sp. MC2016-05]